MDLGVGQERAEAVPSSSQRRLRVEDVFAKAKKGKAELPAGMHYYYKMQLFVKDRSCTSDKTLYILFLCTLEGKGKDFMSLKLGREQPTEAHYKALKKIYKMIARPWAEMDLIVEAVQVPGAQPVFFVVDSELTI